MAHEELRKHQVIQKRQFKYRSKDRTFKHGELVHNLLPTSDNNMLMQWRRPFKVQERVEGADYRIQVGHKQKVFHANLLKRYITAEPESPEGTPEPADPTENESEAKEVQAILWEKVEYLKDQGTKLETLNSLQKETVKDVKINPELSEEQQAEIRALLDQYTDIFTDVPSITNVSEHVIQLNSTEPIKARAYSLPHSLR